MRVRSLILTALMAALTAIGAFLKLPLPTGAVTLQVFFTLLAGILLGKTCGAVSQLVYVVLGLLGLPIFTMGGGLSYVLQPTFGFLLGLPAAAWLAGRLSERSRRPARLALACLAAMAALYLIGGGYMALILQFYLHYGADAVRVTLLTLLPCLPADVLKGLCAVLLCRKILPRLHAY